jgi:hypothetical protein
MSEPVPFWKSAQYTAEHSHNNCHIAVHGAVVLNGSLPLYIKCHLPHVLVCDWYYSNCRCGALSSQCCSATCRTADDCVLLLLWCSVSISIFALQLLALLIIVLRLRCNICGQHCLITIVSTVERLNDLFSVVQLCRPLLLSVVDVVAAELPRK